MAFVEVPEVHRRLSTFGFNFCFKCPFRFYDCVIMAYINRRSKGVVVECKMPEFKSLAEEMVYPCLHRHHFNKHTLPETYDRTMKELFDCDRFGYVSISNWRF